MQLIIKLASSLTAGILTLNALLLTSPSLLKAQSAPQRCEVVLTANKKRLENGRNLQVRIEKRDISEQYPDYPQGRPHQYIFSLKGAMASSVMTSPQLLTAIAREVIQGCSSAGMVSLGLANSGDVITFGWFSGGRINSFECLEPSGRGAARPLKWGQVYCL